MARTILKVFFRKVARSDFYLLIKLVGLSAGISACLLIFLYVADEYQFDRHHKHAHNTYRLLLENPRTGSAVAIHAGVMHRYLDDRIPGVEHIARIIQIPDITLNAGREPIVESAFITADPSILDIWTFDFVSGDPETALSDPHALILTKPAAERFFGDEDPIGRTVVFENMFTFIVRAVIEAPPRQSHVHFSMLCSIEGMAQIMPSALTSWSDHAVNIYLRLDPGTDPNGVADHVRTLLWEANPNYRDRINFSLQPMLDIRLHSGNIEWDVANTSSITIVRIFSVTAVLILLLACFNFVNLSVALVMKRAREVGIKKVLGVSRLRLILQCMAETTVLGIVSILVALVLAEISLPWLNLLSGKELVLWRTGNTVTILLFLAASLLVIAIVAGGYPSLVVSRFRAVDAMKGTHAITSVSGLRSRRYRFNIRHLLVMLQFAVSIALIISSVTIYRQMHFLTQRYPGYERENLLKIKNPWDEDAPGRAVWLREQLLQIPAVTDVSLAHNIPPVPPKNYTHLRYSSPGGEETLHSAIISCDTNYFRTLQSRFTRGRDFLAHMTTDPASATIINATAAKLIGVSDPVGISVGGFYDGKTRRVIGVVDDIHFSSMHEEVGPMAFFISSDQYPQNWLNILVRFEPGGQEQVIEQLEYLWQKEATLWPLQYQFVEDLFMAQYQDDRRVMHILSAFSGLAILLSVLGLLGLALHASVARTKEIGIRKVLGASRKGITHMIISEFGILVVLSNLIAWPAAYFFINRWLENFAYRVDITWLLFVVSAIAVYIIASAVVGIVSYRAAGLNPAHALQAAD